MIINNLQVKSYTCTRYGRSKNYSEARHSSMMAVLQQQTEEHKSKIDKEQEDKMNQRHRHLHPDVHQKRYLKVKHETVLAAHEKQGRTQRFEIFVQ